MRARKQPILCAFHQTFADRVMMDVLSDLPHLRIVTTRTIIEPVVLPDPMLHAKGLPDLIRGE